ncbi:MAG: hypothetical protein Q7T60_08545, partial [Sphingopyxis sp.]|nr:hypothetical protein [Sphingopyxis sp.]
ATRSLQTNQAATDERLQDIGNRIRASFAESSERNIRLAALGAKARKFEKNARLIERAAAIQQLLGAYGEGIADARNVVAKSMLTMDEAIERRATAGLSRLANIGRVIERTAAADRLNVLAASLDNVMSKVDLRMSGAMREVEVRLGRFKPDPLTTGTRARRLDRFGEIAQQRHRDQQLSGFAEAIERKTASADQRLSDLRQRAAILDHSTDQVSLAPQWRAVPSSANLVPRDVDRRKAIAAAAWQLRRTPFPPIVRTAAGYAIAPGFTDGYRDADRFEAEKVIQKIHAQKRVQMLAAVRRKVENTDLAPFIEHDGAMRLPTDVFGPTLRHAVSLASNDQDFIELIDLLVRIWREREAAVRKAEAEAQARKERELTALRERMRPGVERVFGAIRTRMQDGRYPKSTMDLMKEDILVVSKAVGEGRLAMRFSLGTRNFYCASEGLRMIVASLADKPIGKDIIFALGKLTLEEPLDPAELSACLILPANTRAHSPTAAGIESDNIAVPSKGGAER